jgi:non-ribosomal peptide synthase protein (TIGR01720 family)
MGWFTAIYPVALFLQNTPLETLRHVKETIREISECDTHYGIARYLHSHKHLQQFQPEVLFNYFGRVGADLIKGSETAFLSNCEEEIGRISHPHNTMPHFLEVNAIAMENCLRICISYDTQAFDENRMHAWIAAFSKEISKNFREKS